MVETDRRPDASPSPPRRASHRRWTRLLAGGAMVLGVLAAFVLVRGGDEGASGDGGGGRGVSVADGDGADRDAADGDVDHAEDRAVESSSQPISSGIDLPDDVATHSARLGDLQPEPAPAPVKLRIRALGVRASVSPVGVAGDGSGELAVPERADRVVWYQHGPSPGAAGSAVLAGHVDYDGARGVFFRLGQLRPGDQVSVGYRDGTERPFRVIARRQYAKADLPTSDLFVRGGDPVLSLITCGGTFDRSARSYRDNVVVRAVPVES